MFSRFISAVPVGLAVALCGPAWAQAPVQTLTLDNFEDGVGKWARNDKGKSLNQAASVLLVDVLATQSSTGGPQNSSGAGLFTFKAATGSWASASMKISGSQWARFGARDLRFWLNADGQTPGVELLLRGTSRNKDGSSRDVAYAPTAPGSNEPVPVKLSTKSWREVVIPLERFRDKGGASALSNLSGLYLLQFVQRGNWNSRFFTVDDLVVTGTGPRLIAAPTGTTSAGTNTAGGNPDGTSAAASTSTSATPEAGAPVDPNAVTVEIDFLRNPKRPLGRVRTGANISVGAKSLSDGTPGRPFEDAAFASAIKTLAPKMVRIEAGEMVDMIDSSGPSFDFAALQAASVGARAAGAEPLISLGAPASWGLDAKGYASYVTQAARILRRNTSRGPRSFELSLGELPPAQAVAFYRAGYTALKGISRTLRVGGIGSANPQSLRALVAGAPGLDFLSIPFHGANSGTPELSALLGATLSVPTLKTAAQVLDTSRFRLAPLYVTSAGLNAGQDEAGAPVDARLSEMAASAWWSSFLLNGSRLADQVFYNDAANSEWGLLNPQSSAFPPYYALYLWNTFFPAGSERATVKLTGANRGVQILGVNTTTAHNALFVNTSGEPQNVRLTIRGFPVLRQARIRVLQEPLDPVRGITFTDLPKSPFQSFSLPPYSTAVLQFIEPPAKARTQPRR